MKYLKIPETKETDPLDKKVEDLLIILASDRDKEGLLTADDIGALAKMKESKSIPSWATAEVIETAEHWMTVIRPLEIKAMRERFKI